MKLLYGCTRQQIMAPNTRVTRKWEVFAGRNRFYCDGILMSAPHTGVFYLTCFLITGTSILFFAFDCPYLATRITPAIPIVGAILYFFTMSSLLRTTFTDPGIIPRASNDEAAYIEKQIEVPNSLNSPTYRPPPRTKEVLVKGQVVKLKYCFTCKIFRPPRASHCSLCDNCVDRFDHHCPWVGNCVGKRNYRFFYMFLVSLAFLAVFIFSCSITHLVLLMKIDQDIFVVIKNAPFSVIVTFICFFSIWSVIGLAGFHTYLTTSDQTTNEDLKGSFSSKSGQRTINPYSRGNICLNCFHILCGPMTPSLIDRRGVVTDEFMLQMQHHPPNNQLTEITTTQQSGMILHQPMIDNNGMGDMKPRLYDESSQSFGGIYRHRSYDNLQNGNSNSLAHLVDNEIPLSTLDAADSNTLPTTSINLLATVGGGGAGSGGQHVISIDDDNIAITTTTSQILNNTNNLSGSYNNLFRDNLDNISGSNVAIGDDGDDADCLNEPIDLATLPQSVTIHEFQQKNIIDDTLARLRHTKNSNSELENVYSNVPSNATVVAPSMNTFNIPVALPNDCNDNDSNKSDPSLHVYSNLIEERQNQQQQQQQHQQQHQLLAQNDSIMKNSQIQIPQQQQQQQQVNLDKKSQMDLASTLIKPMDIKTLKNAGLKRNSKHDDLLLIKPNSDDDVDPTNLMSSTLLSDDLDLDDPVSAFVINSRNRRYQSSTNDTNGQQQNHRKNSESEIDGKANTNHHHHQQQQHTNSNISNNLSKESNVSSSRLKLLHDTTMIDTALDLDSLDGSSISQTCLVKTAIV